MTEINGNNEIENISERFLGKVKFEARTNYNSQGFEYYGDEDTIHLMCDPMSRNKLINRPYHENRTQMFLIPLSSVVFPPLAPKFDKQDIAIVIPLRGRNTDRWGRNGILFNLIVLSKENADNFVNTAKENPTIPFSLLRKLNKGFFRRESGDPAEIDPGTNIEFFHENGTTSLSKPFPQGFNPNQK